MKLITIILFSLLSLTGCDSRPDNFTHLSSVETRARGVSIMAEGNFAQIGMFNNTCLFEIQNGFIGNDFDLIIGEEDFVQDTRHGVTIASGSGSNLAIFDNNLSYYNIDISGKIDLARITDSGFVVLANNENSCSTLWIDPSGNVNESMEVDCNYTDFDVDPVTENVYITTPDGLKIGWQGDPPLTHDISANLVSYDPTIQAIYTGMVNESIVSGILSNGSMWELDIGLPISSIDNMGVKGDLAIIAGDQELGSIVIVDGTTGIIESSFITPSTANNISVSDSGSIIAITLDSEVHFFNIE